MLFFRKTPQEKSLGDKIKETFKGEPELSSERLIYKKIVPENADDMYEYSHLDEVPKYLLWMPHSGPLETQRYVRLLQKKYASGSFWDFGLTYRENGKFIGTCGITSYDEDENSIEIGYVLNPDYWGRELAVEAARTVMKFCFDTYGVSLIKAKFMEGNDRSLRVMQKLGMKLEGVYRHSMYVKGDYKTIHVYFITREDFSERN